LLQRGDPVICRLCQGSLRHNGMEILVKLDQGLKAVRVGKGKRAVGCVFSQFTARIGDLRHMIFFTVNGLLQPCFGQRDGLAQM